MLSGGIAGRVPFRVWLVIPAVAVLSLVVFFPLVYSLAISVSSFTFIDPAFRAFTFPRNYIAALKDPYFAESVVVTVIFTVGVVLLEFLSGFTLAYLLNRKIRFKRFFLSILIIPMLMTPVAVGLIWRLILHPQLGILNYLLSLIGRQGRAWLGDSATALPTLIFVDIWHQVPFMMLILLAGLTSLPNEPFEAASIDGATEFQAFRFITLPLMRQTIAIAILLRIIVALKTYDLVYVMTKGGPGNATEIISYFIYRKAFSYMDIGQASSLSYLLLLAVSFVSVFLVRYVMRSATESEV